MTHDIDAIILAGGVRPAPLAAALEQPVMTLPVRAGYTLLAEWRDAALAAGAERLRVITGTSHFAHHFRASTLGHVDVTLESGRWRGTAGALRDYAEEHIVVAIEAGAVVPHLLPEMIARARSDGATIALTPDDTPLGIFACQAELLREVPEVGFFDLKEQLLPALHARGCGAVATRCPHGGPPIRRLEEYLDALNGLSIVEPGAQVASDAFVHESVVLDGARIESGAVVARSVIGPRVIVEEGSLVRDELVVLNQAREARAG